MRTNRVFYVLLLITAACWLTACKGFGDTSQRECVFLPGESLVSDIMTPLIYEDNGLPYKIETYTSNQTGEQVPNRLRFVMMADFESQMVRLSEWHKFFGRLPLDNVFDTFGSEEKPVRDAFYGVFNTFVDYSTSAPKHSTITVFYSEKADVRIIAEYDFAGIPAGENLYPSAADVSSQAPLWQLPSSFIPEGYSPIDLGFLIRIPIEHREIIKKTVKFHVEIPVKVGMYLHYLKDKQSIPDAQMEYQDWVLVGDVVSGIWAR